MEFSIPGYDDLVWDASLVSYRLSSSTQHDLNGKLQLGDYLNAWARSKIGKFRRDYVAKNIAFAPVILPVAGKIHPEFFYVSCGCWLLTCRRSSTSISLRTKRISGMSVSSGVRLAHSAITGMRLALQTWAAPGFPALSQQSREIPLMHAELPKRHATSSTLQGLQLMTNDHIKGKAGCYMTQESFSNSRKCKRMIAKIEFPVPIHLLDHLIIPIHVRDSRWFPAHMDVKSRRMSFLDLSRTYSAADQFDECVFIHTKQITKKLCLRCGWVFLERTRILSGIQFTTHFMEIFVVETKKFVGSFVHVILTRQTCGQRSGKDAESQRQALGHYFSE